jgi:hypothetical protein
MMVKRRPPADKNGLADFCDSLARHWNFRTSFELFRLNRPPASPPQLLALSAWPSFEIYAEKMSFISGDGSYLLRVIENKMSGNLEGHLIHSLPQKYQQVFIELDGLAGEYLTDSHGLVNFGKIELDTSQIRINLCPPAAIFKFKQSWSWPAARIYPQLIPAAGWEQIVLDLEYFSATPDQVLKVQIGNIPEGREIARVVLVINQQETLIAVPQKGLGLFELPARARDGQFNIYE